MAKNEPLHITTRRIRDNVSRALSKAQDELSQLTYEDLPANVKNMAHEIWGQIEKMRWRLERGGPSR